MGITSKNLLFLLLATILFVVLSLPFTYNLTTQLLKPIGFSTITKNDCPSTAGILGHSIVFLTVILILFMLLKDSENYFRGLANPGKMKLCNNAQLIAEKFKNNDCAKAAKTCLKNPEDISQECSKALSECSKHSSPVQKYVVNNCSNLSSIN